MTEITLPDGVSRIDYGAFSGCESLTAIALPDGILSIKGSTFHNCTDLTALTLPATVTTVEQDAFSGCAALKDVHYGGSERDKYKIDVAAENGELSAANWRYAVEEEYHPIVNTDAEEEKETPPWLITAGYIAVILLTIGLLILMFRQKSDL